MIGTSKWPLSFNLMMVQSLDGKPTAAFASAVFFFFCSTSNFFSDERENVSILIVSILIALFHGLVS